MKSNDRAKTGKEQVSAKCSNIGGDEANLNQIDVEQNGSNLSPDIVEQFNQFLRSSKENTLMFKTLDRKNQSKMLLEYSQSPSAFMKLKRNTSSKKFDLKKSLVRNQERNPSKDMTLSRSDGNQELLRFSLSPFRP